MRRNYIFAQTDQVVPDKGARDRAGSDSVVAIGISFAIHSRFQCRRVLGRRCVRDLGFKAVKDPFRIRDVHATILHLMGLSDLQLTYYNAGRNMRLTDTGGRVMQQVVA